MIMAQHTSNLYVNYLFILALIICNLHFIRSENVELCVDNLCSKPISLGRTSQSYSSIKENVLSFKNEAEVIVYGKFNGKYAEYLDAKIGEKRGLIPRRFVKEQKVIVQGKNLIKLDTEKNNEEKALKEENFSEDKIKVLKNGNILFTAVPHLTDKENSETDYGIEINGKPSFTSPHTESSIESNENDKKTLLKNNEEDNEFFILGDSHSSSVIDKIENNEVNFKISKKIDTDNDVTNNKIEAASSVKDTKELSKDGSAPKLGEDDSVGDSVKSEEYDIVVKDTYNFNEKHLIDLNGLNKDNSKITESEENDGSLSNDVSDTVNEGDLLDKSTNDINKHLENIQQVKVNVILDEFQNDKLISDDSFKQVDNSKKIVNELNPNLKNLVVKDNILPSNDAAVALSDENKKSVHDETLLTSTSSVGSVKIMIDNVTPSPRLNIIDGTTILLDDDDSSYNEETTADIQSSSTQSLSESLPSVMNSEYKTYVPSLIQTLRNGKNIDSQELPDAVEESEVLELGKSSVDKSDFTTEDMSVIDEDNENLLLGIKLPNLYKSSDESNDYEGEEFGKPKVVSLLNVNVEEDTVSQDTSHIENNHANLALVSHSTAHIENNNAHLNIEVLSTKEIGVDLSLKSNILDRSTHNLDIFNSVKAENSKLDDVCFKESLTCDVNSESSSTQFVTGKDENVKDVLDEGNPEIIDDLVMSSESNDQESYTVTEHFLAMLKALLGDELALALEAEIAHPHLSAGSLTFLLILSGIIVLLYTVHLILFKISREGPIIRALNDKDKEYRIIKAENEQLIIQNTQLQSCGTVDNPLLHQEIKTLKESYIFEKQELEQRILQLENELEESANNGLQLHKMLEELLSSQRDASIFQASVDSLQAMLDGQQEKVQKLTSDLSLKTRLNQELQTELKTSKDKNLKLEYQIEQLSHSLEVLGNAKAEFVHKLEEEIRISNDLRQIGEDILKDNDTLKVKITDLSNEMQILRDTYDKLYDSFGTKEAELQVAKECLKQIQSQRKNIVNEDVSSLFNIVEIKGQLRKLAVEKDRYKNQLEILSAQNNHAQESITALRNEMENLREAQAKALKEKEDATGRLKVLTEYFKEKEEELTRELESQEGLRVNAEVSVDSVNSKLNGFQLEIATYKNQIENLKTELNEQEQSYKVQIAGHERRAHESWLASRAAERKQEELRVENNQLKNRLLLSQKEKDEQIKMLTDTQRSNNINGIAVEKDLEINRERDISPPPLPPGLPPPPPIFGPPGALPPGLPPLPGMPPFMGPIPPPLHERRLPPAGGISFPSSPPYSRRMGSPFGRVPFSPVSDRSQFSDRRSPISHHRRSPDRWSDRNRRSPTDWETWSPDNMREGHDKKLDGRSSHSRGSYSHRNISVRRLSPDRWLHRAPDGYSYEMDLPYRSNFNDSRFSPEELRSQPPGGKGAKTSTPLEPADR